MRREYSSISAAEGVSNVGCFSYCGDCDSAGYNWGRKGRVWRNQKPPAGPKEEINPSSHQLTHLPRDESKQTLRQAGRH